MLVDAHCHLYFEQYDGDRDGMLDASRKAGVGAFVNVGIDEASTRAALDLAGRHSDVWATAGLHPHSAHLASEADFDALTALARRPRIVAVGEVGLDYFKSEAPAAVQKRVFERMIGIATEAGLPVVVHSRDAFDDTLNALRSSRCDPARVVFHCFSYGTDELRRALELGCRISFTCNVTFPSAKALREAVREVPMDRFMIETDSPYLAPQPLRGRRNDPSNLVYLVREIAALKGAEPEEIERRSTENAAAFFRLDAAAAERP